MNAGGYILFIMAWTAAVLVMGMIVTFWIDGASARRRSQERMSDRMAARAWLGLPMKLWIVFAFAAISIGLVFATAGHTVSSEASYSQGASFLGG